MDHNDELQRTAEWHAERLGIPTGSMFNAILTQPRSKAYKKAGKLSDTAMSYALDLVAERLTRNVKQVRAAALDHGKEKEPVAIRKYQEKTGNKVIECGFIKHPEIECGVSPDGLIGIDGGIEVKCPVNTSIHLKTMMSKSPPKEYVAQIQGQMWVADLEWVDFVSYNEEMPEPIQLVVIPVKRDDKYIANLELKIKHFISKLEEIYEQVKNAA